MFDKVFIGWFDDGQERSNPGLSKKPVMSKVENKIFG